MWREEGKLVGKVRRIGQLGKSVLVYLYIYYITRIIFIQMYLPICNLIHIHTSNLYV